MPPQQFHRSTLGAPPHARAASVARRLAVLLAVLAMALHGIVVQSHFDARSVAPSLALVVGAAQAQTERQGGAHQPLCFICETAAVAGGMVLGAAPAVPMPGQFDLAASEAPRVDVIAVRPSHAWRSRAPPSFLI